MEISLINELIANLKDNYTEEELEFFKRKGFNNEEELDLISLKEKLEKELAGLHCQLGNEQLRDEGVSAWLKEIQSIKQRRLKLKVRIIKLMEMAYRLKEGLDEWRRFLSPLWNLRKKKRQGSTHIRHHIL